MEMERDDDLKYVLENIDELVIKEVDGSGGHGMLIGPKSTKQKLKILVQAKITPGGIYCSANFRFILISNFN